MPELALPSDINLMPSASPSQVRLITGEELLGMENLGPCELVKGRIVPMPPAAFDHGEIEVNIGTEIRAFVKANKIGRVSGGEAGIYTHRNPDTVRGADVLFISNERLKQRTSAAFLEVAPDLVVEILSPSNTMSEMLQKIREYFAIGVRLIWVVDPVPQCVYAYRSLTDVRQFTAEEHLPGDDVLPSFSLPVAKIFP